MKNPQLLEKLRAMLGSDLKLDDEQLEAVFCDRNCVVVAGAGSGKTTVLAYRFLRLVLEGKAHVDEILTLTFSRSAAAEMQERIHGQLLKLRGNELIDRELERFGDAVISTLDSFCKRIVDNDLISYGYPLDTSLDLEANDILARECAIALTREYKEHPGFQFLAEAIRPGIYIEELWVSLAKQVFHPGSSLPEDPEKLLEDYLSVQLESTRAKIIPHLEDLLSLESSSFNAYLKAIKVCQQVYAILTQNSHAEQIFEQLHEKLVPQVKLSKQVGSTWEQSERYKELADEINPQLASLLFLSQAYQDLPIAKDVFAAIAIFQERYLTAKQQRGILTYADYAHLAIEVLLNNTGVRNYYKKRFKYILVDEFQDNNQLQKDLLYLLAERKELCSETLPTVGELESDKLFFVGDEKQSIYRFRGADVTVFKALADEIAGNGGEKIELLHNYRSSEPLVTFYNELFSKIFISQGRAFEADYYKLRPKPPKAGEVTVESKISFYFKPLESDETINDDDNLEAGELLSAVEAEATLVANLITEMVNGDDYLIREDDHSLRPPYYSDIAILSRSGGNQVYFEKALRKSKIPYTLRSVQSLFLEAPTNDIYLMLQLALYPDDRQAYVGLLRSPFCRLTDGAILQVLEPYSESATPFDWIEAESTLAVDDYQAFASAGELYRHIRSSIGKESTAHLVSFLWYEGGYRYHLLNDPARHVYLEHGTYLIELAHSFDQQKGSLIDYLDFIRPKLGKNEKVDDLYILRKESLGVNIMSIHASKGLEFPIVFLVNSGSSGRPNTTPCWVSMQHEGQNLPLPYHMRDPNPKGPPKALNIVYQEQKQLYEAQDQAELKRLLYVALTRAESHLVVTGCENRINRGAEAHTKNLMMMVRKPLGLEDLYEATVESPLSIGIIEDATESLSGRKVTHSMLLQRYNEVKAHYEAIEEERTLYSNKVYTVTTLADEMQVQEGLKRALPVLGIDPLLNEERLFAPFGTFVHELIQAQIDSLVAPYQVTVNALTISEALPLIPREFMQLSNAQQTAVAEEALTLVNTFFKSPLWAELIREDLLLLEAEKRFVYRKTVADEESLVYGAVDLVAHYPNEIRIIDFKSDEQWDSEKHQAQLALYREALAAITDKPIYSTICYLRSIGEEIWFTA